MSQLNALVPHRGVSRAASSRPLVKLVFQRSDKQLKSIQKQLCISAKDLAGQLSKVTALVNEVHILLIKESERPRGGDDDSSEILRVWAGISKLCSTYMKDIRTMAVCGPVTISDFLCEFTDYMCSSSDDVQLKREEAKTYSRHLLAEGKQTSDGMRNFVSLAQYIRDFRDCWLGNKCYPNAVDAKCAAIVEKLESITNVRPSNDLVAMLDNVSFPGVESASMTLLPAQWATQLYKMLEGDNVSRVETISGKHTDISPVNVLGVFLSVCVMLSKDLNAVDEAIQCHAGNGQLGVLKTKLGIVYSSYSSLSDALKAFAHVLSGVSPSDSSRMLDRRPLARFKRWCILLLKRHDF